MREQSVPASSPNFSVRSAKARRQPGRWRRDWTIPSLMCCSPSSQPCGRIWSSQSDEFSRSSISFMPSTNPCSVTALMIKARQAATLRPLSALARSRKDWRSLDRSWIGSGRITTLPMITFSALEKLRKGWRRWQTSWISFGRIIIIPTAKTSQKTSLMLFGALGTLKIRSRRWEERWVSFSRTRTGPMIMTWKTAFARPFSALRKQGKRWRGVEVRWSS
mmetsp:Transcript_40224/g.116180  ORF Transcript_40224/g.116180 Transcript_40224/m.116180 type:complete len:220 (-) Transcript_40224:1410-2069(-)